MNFPYCFAFCLRWLHYSSTTVTGWELLVPQACYAKLYLLEPEPDYDLAGDVNLLVPSCGYDEASYNTVPV